MRPRSLRGLIALMGAAVGTVTALLGGVTYYFADKSMTDQLNARIMVESRALVAIGDPAQLAHAIRNREAQPSVGNLGYMVFDAQGRHVAGALRGALPPEGYWDCMTYVRADGVRAEAQSLNSRLPWGGHLVVVADRTIVDQANDTVLILFGTAFGLVLLFGLASAFIVGRVVQGRLAGIASPNRSTRPNAVPNRIRTVSLA